MSNILFSIIVPVYNQEKYLEKCINSVLEQNFFDYELILVNDGSTDSSGLICDNYAKKDSRIKVIHKENGGVSSARKAGAEIANGQYIVPLDSDDYMEEDSLCILANIIKKHSPDIISGGFMAFNETFEKEFIPHSEEGLYTDLNLEKLKCRILFNDREPFFTYTLAPSVWSNIMKKNFYLKYQLCVNNKIKLGEDLCVTFPAFLDCKSLYVLKRSLVRYRFLFESISHRYRPQDIDDLKLLLEHLSNIDLNRYNAKNQLDVYVLSRIHAFLINSAHNLNNYNDFSHLMNKMDTFYLEHFKKIHNSSLSLKAKIIRLLIKNKCWWAFWIMANRKIHR